MCSVSSLLNNDDSKPESNRPSVLDISNLLCSDNDNNSIPSLSPPTPSPATCSPYPFHPMDDNNNSNTWSPMLLTNDLPKKPAAMASSVSVASSFSSNGTLSEESEKQHPEEQASNNNQPPLKPKRRRANAKQLKVLNSVFDRTFFPSTQLRAELGRQLGMSPRTVQIWFQNRRQAIRTRERQRLLRIRDESSSCSSSATD